MKIISYENQQLLWLRTTGAWSILLFHQKFKWGGNFLDSENRHVLDVLDDNQFALALPQLLSSHPWWDGRFPCLTGSPVGDVLGAATCRELSTRCSPAGGWDNPRGPESGAMVGPWWGHGWPLPWHLEGAEATRATVRSIGKGCGGTSEKILSKGWRHRFEYFGGVLLPMGTSKRSNPLVCPLT